MKEKTNHKAIRALLAAIAALLTLALAPVALAGPPNHARTPANDISGLNKACGTAVDTEGDVYVSSAGEDKIKVYDPDHALIAQITNANDPCGLAVNGRGELLVSEQGTGNVVMYVPDSYPLTGSPTYSSSQPVDSSGEAQGISIDPFDDTLLIAKGDRIEAYFSEAQEVEIKNATGGSFKLRFEGEETDPLPHNATTDEVDMALEELGTIGADGVSVSLPSALALNFYRIVFAGVHAYADQPQIEAISSLTPPVAKALSATSTSGGVGIDERQSVTLGGVTGGSFKLKFEGQETTAIAFDAPARKSEGASSVEAALEALSNIAPGDVSVTHSSNGYAVSFEGALAAKDVPQIETITELLPNEVQKVTVDATAGTYNLVATTAVGVGTTTLGSNLVTAVSTSLGAYHVGDAISGSGIPLGATIAAVGAGTLEISANANASTNNAALTATETTGAIEFNAFANTGEGAGSIEAALEALPGLDTGDVSVTGGPGGPGGTNPYLVTFEGAFGGRNVPQMTPKKAGITGDATIATVTEGASISSSTSMQGWSGRIGEGDFGEATGVGAYTYKIGLSGSATRYLFVADKGTDEAYAYSGPSLTALKQRETIDGPPGEDFEFGAAGSPVAVDQANGHFLVYDDGHEMVDEFEATGEYLDQFTDPAFEDAEPTGIAVYPQWNEIQTVSVSATGGSFKLGFEGEETEAIASNAKGKVLREALEELTGIGAGNVFVEGNGEADIHSYTVHFIADLGNGDVASLTCDPSGLTGAGETCSANVSRQGSGPGQVYVTAGSGSAAKLLAFGPLVAPTRALLPELSHVLEKAAAVATDSYGNVYVGDQTKIHVYDNEGDQLSEFEVKGEGKTRHPDDLAVDSEGNLYLVDHGAQVIKTQMTYYTPSQYPPTAGTTYARHEPPLSITEGIGVITVNPADDHLFVGMGQGNNAILEWGSAKDGSPGPSTFRSNVFYNGASGIGVYGANGYVYASPPVGAAFSVLSATETLTEITGDGCSYGEPGKTPVIGVDQSNGHTLEFKEGQNGNAAREYDAAGTCVAEFGEFSTDSGNADIAADNACAIHRDEDGDPEPLDETTTPTCAEFDPANGNVYVAMDGADNTVQPYDVTAFGPLSYGERPSALTGEANGLGAGQATLNGTVDPNQFLLEDCRFEYLTEVEYEQNLANSEPAFEGAGSEECTPDPEDIGEGGNRVAVHAEISGVEPKTTRYRFRLVTSNTYGESTGEAGLFGPPQLTAKAAQPVLYDEATLRGEVDPSGLATGYRFEYGLAEGEYTQSTPVGQLEPGDGPVAVKAPLTGLADGTEYHFRLVAENEANTVAGEDQTLITLQRREQSSCPNTEYRVGLSANLPDCRAYELTTPADTRGFPLNDPGGVEDRIFNGWLANPRGAGAGESLGFYAHTLPSYEGSGDADTYRSSRGAGDHPAAGWGTELTGPSYAQGAPARPEGGSADQRYRLWNIIRDESLLARGHYLRTPAGTANPACTPPGNEDPKAEYELVGCGEEGIDPQAESRFIDADGKHVIFFSKAHLEDGAPPALTQAIYDREAGSESAEVVSVKPDGTPFGGGQNATYVGASEDGAAILFEVGGTLYLRRGGATIEIVSDTHEFAGLSEDGTRVFFMNEEIVSTPPPATLYVCDTEVGSCVDGVEPPGLSEIAEESVFVNVSPDGSGVLFSSEDVLGTPGEENENGEEAEPGEHNLYAWDGTDTRFVGQLIDQDFDFFGTPFINSGEEIHSWVRAINPGQLIGRAYSPTRASADGEVFVFQSHAQLTDYDNTLASDAEACWEYKDFSGVPPVLEEGRCGEIYRYDATAPLGQQLLCISCDPTGAPPRGEALLQMIGYPGNTLQTALIANVTDDGDEVFFQSQDRLVPEDANQVGDVYQWKAQGAGQGAEECKRPGGCLALISSGQGEGPSYLYGMSADGHDVFFETSEQLSSADIPGSPSIYDARIEGGIPALEAEPPCRGDACQGEGSTPPALTAPGTSAGVPDGNVAEQPKAKKCPKGKRKVKRKGKARCVKKAKQHKKRHRADHKGRAQR